MSWFRSVCKKSLSRKDRMQRHVMSKHRNAGLYPISNSSNVFTEMSVVSLRTLFYTHDCRNDAGPENRPGFDLYYNKLQRQFTFPRRGLFGVIYNGSLRIQKC